MFDLNAYITMRCARGGWTLEDLRLDTYADDAGSSAIAAPPIARSRTWPASCRLSS